MTSPVLELQGAIVPRLKQTAAVTAICGSRVYDHVPRGANGNISATMPFVGIASSDALTDDADCIRGSSVAINIDCWSDKPGFAEVQKLAEAVKQALHDDETLTLGDNALLYLTHNQTRFIRETDGIVSHAVLTFDAFIEQP
jgi:hypothetical protein